MSYITVNVEPLDPSHDRGAFDCGQNFIDRYIKKRCLVDHNLHKARVYVATEPDSTRVIGFYTLSLTALKPEDTSPEEAQAKFGTWAIPLVYLGQIGVDKEFQNGKGVGTAMMIHAFQKTIDIADIAGTYGMMLDAIDEERAQFYERLDFFRFDAEGDGRIKMICPLTKMRLALEQG